jgi:hypothetical protein
MSGATEATIATRPGAPLIRSTVSLAPVRARQMAMRASFIFPGVSKRLSGYSDEWYTPERITTALGAFDLDPCAGPKSHARRNIRRPACGLRIPWEGRVWLNPPYSNVHEWLDRFTRHGNGIALVNARPETQWFQCLARGADALLWIKGRVYFEKPDGSTGHTTVGSVLVAYGKHNAKALRNSKLPGLLTPVDHCANTERSDRETKSL